MLDRSSMPRMISLTVLVVLIVFLGITFFQVIYPFLLPLFVAGVVAVVCQPMHNWILRKMKGRVYLASGVTTTAVMIIVLLPIVLGTAIAGTQLYKFTSAKVESGQAEEWADDLQEKFDETVRAIAANIPGENDPDEMVAVANQHVEGFLRALGEQSLGIAQSFAGSLLSAIIGALIATFMFMIALYYFLADGEGLLHASEQLIPVHIDYQRRLRQQFGAVVRAVVLATFLAAIAQALLTAIMMYVVGFKQFFLIFILASLSALIPIAGTWLVWAPGAIYLFATGSYFAGTMVVLFGALVIGMMDNVIRTYVLNANVKLHPLLAFVSVLGGLKVLGLWGVFIGPIVASVLHALVVIFNEELKELSKDKFGEEEQKTESAEQPAKPAEAAADAPATAKPAAPSEEPATKPKGKE